MPPILRVSHLLLLAVLLLCWTAACDRTSPDTAAEDAAEKTLSAYPVAKTLADFSLQNQTGQTVGKSSLEDQWHLLFFGFTHCPDICPATLQRLSLTQKAWSANGPPPEIVLVSADPDRDSPERMNEYLSAFQGDLTGLTGDIRQIEALALQLGARISPPISPVGDPDHSAAVYVIDPQGNLAAVVAPDFQPQTLADALQNLIQERSDART